MLYIKLIFTILKYGTSYAIATAFFPKLIRDKILLLYAFVREPDNIVDEPSAHLDHHYALSKQKLETLYKERSEAHHKLTVADPKRGLYIQLFHTNHIPFAHSTDFYQAMIDDCSVHRYKTYNQLESYMYGSACVVGLMMNKIIGVDNPEADQYACALGHAMQLTNFLRDIKEDYIQLNRIYMPEEVLNTFDLTHQNIIHFCTHPIDTQSTERKNFQGFMKEMIIRCRNLYKEAEKGYRYLPKSSKQGITLAADLYENILDKIERNGLDIFTKSARTTLFDKLLITWKTW